MRMQNNSSNLAGHETNVTLTDNAVDTSSVKKKRVPKKIKMQKNVEVNISQAEEDVMED